MNRTATALSLLLNLLLCVLLTVFTVNYAYGTRGNAQSALATVLLVLTASFFGVLALKQVDALSR